MVWAVSLSTMRLIPHSLTPRLESYGIRSLVEFGKILSPEPIQRSTSIAHHLRLHLNAFRGGPAISEFGWHFTSTHSSSHSFASLIGSGLHVISLTLHPGHG